VIGNVDGVSGQDEAIDTYFAGMVFPVTVVGATVMGRKPGG